MKRTLDILLALSALVILLLPIIMVALMVRVTSPGPIFYWSDRVGRYNRIFKMPKFRSMRIGTPSVATHLLSNPGAYLTPIGSFLRKDAPLLAQRVRQAARRGLHGGDPTWGRSVPAACRSGPRFNPKHVSLKLGPVTLVLNGQPCAYKEKDAAKVVSRERVPVLVSLGSGPGKAMIMSSDLGHDYVSLNADYRS